MSVILKVEIIFLGVEVFLTKSLVLLVLLFLCLLFTLPYLFGQKRPLNFLASNDTLCELNCVPLPKKKHNSYVEALIPQCDGIWRWSPLGGD